MLEVLVVFEISTYIFVLNFGNVEKRLDKKAKVNFKIYDITDWTTNNCNTHIAQYLRLLFKPNQAIKFG